MARTFYLSKLWQGILTRLGILETAVGAMPTADDYNTIADVRAESSHSDNDRILCLENQFVYKFNSSIIATDNGVTVLKPDDITSGNTGRWLSENQLALKTHTHTEYGAKIVNPNQNNFLRSDANGNPVESSYNYGTFAAAGHNHDNVYVPINDFGNVIDAIAEIQSNLGNKVDKPAITSGDIGKQAIFNADGNIVPGIALMGYSFLTGALTANTLKSCEHNKNLSQIFNIALRDSGDHNNMASTLLEATPGNESKSIDVMVEEDVAEPGLIIKIIGA